MIHPWRSFGHGLPWTAVCQGLLYIVDITKLWLTFCVYINSAVLFGVIKYQRMSMTQKKVGKCFLLISWCMLPDSLIIFYFIHKPDNIFLFCLKEWQMGLVAGGIMELIQESFRPSWCERVNDWCVVGGSLQQNLQVFLHEVTTSCLRASSQF